MDKCHNGEYTAEEALTAIGQLKIFLRCKPRAYEEPDGEEEDDAYGNRDSEDDLPTHEIHQIEYGATDISTRQTRTDHKLKMKSHRCMITGR